MPKAPRKTNRQKASKLAERFDRDVLDEDGKLRTLLCKVHSIFRKWHYEQRGKVSTSTFLEMGQKGPMVAIEKLEAAIRHAENILGGSCVKWCSNNNYE